MRRSTLQAWLLATAVLLLLPGVARACIHVDLMVWPPEAGPGDTVQYTITNLTPGAMYNLAIEGYEFPRQEATSPMATGSFTMPDLGVSSRGVTVETKVEHWDINSSAVDDDSQPTKNIVYQPQAPTPGGSSQPRSEPVPATPPAAAPGTGAPTLTGPLSPPGGNGPGPHATRPPRAPSGGGTHAPAHVLTPTATTHGPAAGVGHVATGAVVHRSSRTPVVRVRSVSPNPRRPEWPIRIQHGAQAGQIATFAGARRSPAGDEGLPPGLLVALAALVFAGIGGGGIYARGRARARGPTPGIPDGAVRARIRDLRIEAELQEILVEERLKRFEEEQGRDIAEPGEPVRAGPG
jgi:hypothetical protein